jgi:hypothetical protein
VGYTIIHPNVIFIYGEQSSRFLIIKYIP